MKKVLKLLLYIALSISVVYFVVSNTTMLSNVLMAADFMKRGTEQDIINYAKQAEKDLRNSLETEEQDIEEEKKDDKKETNKEAEDKTYSNIKELAEDYPMGTTYYSLIMSTGEMQIQTICVSLIFGISIGVICFMFITDKKRNIKDIIIVYVISLVVTLIAIEIVQMLILLIAYGILAFVPIDMQFIIMSTAIFLFAWAMNKAVLDAKQQKVEKEESKETRKKNRK